MIILGIDPGLATLGCGIIHYEGNCFEIIAYGSIVTPSTMSMPMRLKIYDELNELIIKYNQRL